MLIEKNDDVEITDYINARRPRAEYYLLNYDAELKLYEQGKAEFLSRNPPIDENVGGGRPNLPGAPTERKALQSVGYDEKHDAYYWLKAVEISWKGLSDRKKLFLDIRRQADKEQGARWVTFTQMRYLEAIEKRYIIRDPWVSDETIRRWWYGIVRRTVEIYLALKIKNK